MAVACGKRSFHILILLARSRLLHLPRLTARLFLVRKYLGRVAASTRIFCYTSGKTFFTSRLITRESFNSKYIFHFSTLPRRQKLRVQSEFSATLFAFCIFPLPSFLHFFFFFFAKDAKNNFAKRPAAFVPRECQVFKCQGRRE